MCEESGVAVRCFVIEEPAFAWEAAAVAVECAVGGDDAVAWDDNAHAVLTVGETDCACASGVIEFGRELAVGSGFAERDFDECVPDSALPV